MRILVIGGTGTIGTEIVRALADRHEVVVASRKDSAEQVDITDAASIDALLGRVGQVDAIVSAAGGAAWKPLADLTDADFAESFGYKLMGQVNIVRRALAANTVRDGGSITLTSGVLAQDPVPNSAAVSLVNGALESFTRAAALESPRGIRVNIVSPGWVDATLRAWGMDPSGGVPAAEVAQVYVASVEGSDHGAVLPAVRKS